MSQAPNGQQVSVRTASPHPEKQVGSHVEQEIIPSGEQNAVVSKPRFDLSATRITEDTDVPPIEPTITIKDGTFAIKGDISFISGLPKSGKSTTTRYIISTALMPTVAEEFDSLGIKAVYCGGRPVVYIDSEQPKAYTKRMREEIKRILDVETLPDNLHTYNWRHHSHQENRQAIEQLFDELPDAAYWIVDGITDFVGGANEEREGNEVIRFFMGAASRLNTTIILLIHENAGGGKMRGHIGSEAERKCGGAITIRKDRENDVHWIEPKLIRGSADFEKYAFYYDTSQHRFVLCDDAQTKNLRALQDKRVGRIVELHRLTGLVFADKEQLLKSEILETLRETISRKPDQSTDAHRKAVERLFKEMVDEHNILTPFGEAKNVFRYLRPVETTPF